MNDDRKPSSFDFVVAVDAVVTGFQPTPGSGVMVGPQHVLTAGHVASAGSSVANGARITLDSNVSDLPARDNPRSPVPANQFNTTSPPLFPENYVNTGAPNDDLALFSLTSNLVQPSDSLGMVVFLDPQNIVGRDITTAGYPTALTEDNPDATSPDTTGRTQFSASGTVHSTNGGGSSGNDVRFTYSESVDTQSGQSGSGVWLAGSLFGETNNLVAGVHTRGVNDVTQIADGTQSGNLITKAVYDDITAQMLADSGAGNAADLPENVIVGSDSTIFSAQTGAGNDFIEGSYRNERFIGQGGNDRFFGGGGNDRYEGGDGVDQALFSGLFADYDFSITDPASASFEFVHARGTQSDGTDSTKDVEFAVFEFEDADNSGTSGYGQDDDGNLFLYRCKLIPATAPSCAMAHYLTLT